jgi:hypothetical protein
MNEENRPSTLRRLLKAKPLGMLAIACLLVVNAPASSQTATGTSLSSPVYRACYAGDKTGTVYRINDPTNGYSAPGAFPVNSKFPSGCAARNDSSFVWNQTGPSGPTGPTGPEGAIGPAGPVGPQGPAGVIGPNISLSGNLSIGGSADVGALSVRGPGTFSGALTAAGLDVGGDGYFNYVNSRGDATVTRKLVVGGEEINFGNSRVDGTLIVRGEAYLGWKRVEATVTLSPSETGTALAACATNRIISGGYSSSTDEIRVTQSKPTDGNGGWFVRAVNESAVNTVTITVYAICSNIGT